MTIKVIENSGSLSENDLKLLAGTELILSMMRNRLLILVDKDTTVNWEDLTSNVEGFYHIRSVDQKRLFQIWFELATDYDKFQRNLFVAKMGADA